MIAWGLRFGLVAIVLIAFVSALSLFAPLLPQDMVDAYANLLIGLNDWGWLFPLETFANVLKTAVAFFITVLIWDVWMLLLGVTRSS